MSRKQLQTLVKRVTGLAMVVLAMGASEARTISTSQSISSTVEESFVTNDTGIFNLLERGIGVEPLLLAQAQQSRTALVIGNSDYLEGALSNPRNDATDIAEALKSLGFEVTLRLDLDLRAMEDAIDAFNQQLSQGEIGLFFYAGHGVQVEGENYLIPLNADLTLQSDVRHETLALGKVLNAMTESGTTLNIIIIDACRDNPFHRQWRSRSRSLSSERGLAPTEPPEGTIISFSTAPDDAAADGGGHNSPYTARLLQHIMTEGADVATMFRRVRTDVISDTDGTQSPWYQESRSGDFSFNPPDELVTLPTPTSSVVNSPTPASPTQEPTPTPPNNPSTPVPSTREPTPIPEPNPVSAESTLISAVTGISYQPLRDALAAGDFEEADDATRSLMLQAAGRQSVENFRPESLTNFSCEDFRIIDQLWLNYSNGKFGFSVQQEIYQSLGGTSEYNAEVWNNFGSRVGWRVNNRWLLYDNVRFSPSAPQGHLPFFGRFGHWEDRKLVMQQIFSLSCREM